MASCHTVPWPSVCRQAAFGVLRGERVRPGSDGLVQQRGDVLLLVAVRGAEHHHAILRETASAPGARAPLGLRELPQPVPAVPTPTASPMHNRAVV